MRIAVVGGTGGFGVTICRLLIQDGHDVVAIGRSRERGDAARRALPSLTFRSMDREEITSGAIALLGAQVVVDASGPFQGMETRLAEAAMEAGAHYVDIADDRAFVSRVRRLDGEARRHRTAIITGASSVPALSSAIAIELADGLDAVDRVDVSITASSQAAFGRAVLSSMLSGAGRPIAHQDGPAGIGMMEYRHIAFSAGPHELVRHVLSCDVPDHDELAPLLPGRPVVRFRAGSELPIHNWSMWSIALCTRLGILRRPQSLIPLAEKGRRLMRGGSDGRSGMKVEVRGRSNGRPRLREWTLVATDGHGPTIPCLVVPEIIHLLSKGEIPNGARSAAGIVASEAILRRMPEGSFVAETKDISPSPLYRRIMRGDFERLDPAVRDIHDDPWILSARGRASVSRSRNPLAGIVCAMMGFPPASSGLPVRVTFERMGQEEKWTREFGRHRFSSRLSEWNGHLIERFGPLSFRFRLEVRSGKLCMLHRGWTAFGISMPRWLGPSGTATEGGEDGLFAFDVPIALPLIGEIIRYKGWLQTEKKAE